MTHVAVPESVIDSPIILTGRGGSGTRMLSKAVAGAGVFLGNKINQTQDSVEWVDLLYAMAVELLEHGHDDQELLQRWRQRLRHRAREILGVGEWDQIQRWGWKLPETMIVARPVLDIFPAARLVHLVRHPITCSFRRTHMTSRISNHVGGALLRAAYDDARLELGDPNRRDIVSDNAVSWRYQVGRVAAVCGDPSLRDRCLQVRYEDICDDWPRVADNISNFLGSPPTALKSPTPDRARMASWNWSLWEATWVWSLCGQVAERFGYGLSDDGRPTLEPTDV